MGFLCFFCFSFKLFVFFFLVYAETGGMVDENTEMETGHEMQDGEAGSPRGVLEVPVVGGDSDNSSSSCSSTEKLTPRLSPQLSTPVNRDGSYASQWKNMIGSIKKKSSRRFSTLPILTNYDLSGKNLWKKLARLQNGPHVEALSASKPSWSYFKYEELAAATDNFCPGENIKIFSFEHFDTFCQFTRK